MKNPVMDLKDFVDFLKQNKEAIAKNMAALMTPQQLKQASVEAVVGNTGERVTTFKEILDNIRQEGYHQGQLSIVNHLILVLEKNIKNFEEQNDRQAMDEGSKKD